MKNFLKRQIKVIIFSLFGLLIKQSIFLKIFKSRFKSHRIPNSELRDRESTKSRLEKNIINLLDKIFATEYYGKLKDIQKIKELVDSNFNDGQGKYWAEHFYSNGPVSENLKKIAPKKNIINEEIFLVYKKIPEFIVSNKLENSNITHIIEIGSCSGRNLEFFKSILPNINYISLDIHDEILNFQKKKYESLNFNYYKGYAENIDDCINHYKIKNDNLIIFSSACIQYFHPIILETFFYKLKNFSNFNLFLDENTSNDFLKHGKLLSEHRGSLSFSHNYDAYAKKFNFKIREKKIIFPFSKEDKINKDTLHCFYHLTNKLDA